MILVAVNQQDDDYKFNFVKLPHPIQTSSEANVEEKGSSGAVWAALLLLLLIPAVVYVICRSVFCVTFVIACSVKWQETQSFAGRKCVLFFSLPQP